MKINLNEQADKNHYKLAEEKYLGDQHAKRSNSFAKLSLEKEQKLTQT